MSILKRNVIANFLGQGWTALMAFAFIPIYIKFLGIEAYGLIGFYAMLQASFQVLDLGLSQTMNREMARYSMQPGKSDEARDFVRTLEFGYWAIGIAIGVAVMLASPLLARYWIKSNTIPVEIVQQAVMIMGIMTAFHWPLSFYEGGLMGLQKQVLSNSIRIGMVTLSNCGAALILWQVSPTITTFFQWQLAVTFLNAVFFTHFLWRSLPKSVGSPKFTPSLIANIWRFTAGMGALTLTSILFMQMDKVLLSKLLDLEIFGYYSLAWVVSNAIPMMLVGPIFNALYPRFTALVATKDVSTLDEIYHQGIQVTAVVILPVAAILAFYSYEILLLWTGDAAGSRIVARIIPYVVFGMVMSGLVALTFAMQLAYGWTSLMLRIHVFLLFVYVPLIFVMTNHYGARGAAAAWFIINSVYLLLAVPLTHRRILPGATHRVFIADIGPAFAVTLIVVGASRWMISSPMDNLKTVVYLPVVFVVSLVGAIIAAPRVRSIVSLECDNIGIDNWTIIRAIYRKRK